MSDAEFGARVGKTEVDIAELKQLVNTLIVEVVRPATEVAVAAQARSLENEQRFQSLLDEAREDRMNTQRQFEENKRQFDENKRRFDAQQEIMQSMLIQIAEASSSGDGD